MKKSKVNILESLELSQGLEIDLDEGWRKIISRQFRGNAGRGFSELIQNFLDSYPSNTPWEERLGKIETNEKSISITDFGEGMDRKRLKLIATLGGTDKSDDPSKIGTFGIGFFSVFNPQLGTKKVIVTTKCEGHNVELDFIVKHPEKRPKISSRVIDAEIAYSTKIEVEFDNETAPRECMEYAARSLKYYPCRVLVNGRMFPSVWEEARNLKEYIFKEGYCDGFLRHASWGNLVNLLCKYEHIIDMPMSYLITGGHNMNKDLRDFHRKEMPYVPNVGATINCNNLSVTISRDSFFLNDAYNVMIKILARQLLYHLGKVLDMEVDNELILANHYILRTQIKDYLLKRKLNQSQQTGRENEVMRKLAEAKVYRLNGRKDMYSLVDIQDMSKKGMPLFYSPHQRNLRWLGGAFKHDFVVLPSKCRTYEGAPQFYDSLFKELFDDSVNLDTIMHDNAKIKELVDRGIVDKSALSPKCRIIGARKISQAEQKALNEIDEILSNAEVKDAIARKLYLPVRSIKSVFFDLEEEGAVISTGLFDRKGKALGESVPDNIRLEDLNNRKRIIEEEQDILLGLHRGHPFIQHLIESGDPHKAYYTLTYLAHEIAFCQKMLVPYSMFYHQLKERLAADMRRALMVQLLKRSQAA